MINSKKVSKVKTKGQPGHAGGVVNADVDVFFTGICRVQLLDLMMCVKKFETKCLAVLFKFFFLLYLLT